MPTRSTVPDAPLLALDSSTERLCLALQAAHGLWRLDEAGGAQASVRLLPAVLELLAEAGLGLSDLAAIAFARGPGAFTGLRTACAVAQGLALGAQRPVLALDSLMIVAEDARAQAGADAWQGWVAMDARMNEAYAGAYRFADGRWQVVHEPALYTLEALQAQWDAAPPAAVAGNALAAFGEQLRPGAAQRVPQERDRPGALMRVAQQAWRDGRGVDAAEAMPLYLRDKVALTTAEREAKR